MNSDSHFLIGNSHHICEDYALSGQKGKIHYAIVADGCSASNDVDIGARILAKTAESVINVVYESHYLSQFYWDMIGRMIISNAQKTIRSLGVSDTALDSTLLFAIGIEGQKQISIFVYGDGAFAYYDFDNKLHVIDIEYISGAPYYLSCRLNEERKNGYFQQYPDEVIVTHYIENETGNLEVYHRLTQPNYFELCFDIHAENYISVLSDGVKTFQGMDFLDTATEFMSFKNHTGEFVKRRMNAIKRKCDKEGIKYQDDISMAGIYLRDKNE